MIDDDRWCWSCRWCWCSVLIDCVRSWSIECLQLVWSDRSIVPLIVSVIVRSRCSLMVLCWCWSNEQWVLMMSSSCVQIVSRSLIVGVGCGSVGCGCWCWWLIDWWCRLIVGVDVRCIDGVDRWSSVVCSSVVDRQSLSCSSSRINGVDVIVE